MKKRLASITVIILAVFFFAWRQTAVQGERAKSPGAQTQTVSEIKAQNFKAVASEFPRVSATLRPLRLMSGRRAKRMRTN
jgi:hypothetical protein